MSTADTYVPESRSKLQLTGQTLLLSSSILSRLPQEHFDLSNIQSLLACMACRSKKQQNFENSPRKYFSTLCLNIETKFMSLDRSKHLAVSALQFCVNHAQAVFHFYFKTINLGVGEWNEVAIFGKYLC